jgi:hypothetical protein
VEQQGGHERKRKGGVLAGEDGVSKHPACKGLREPSGGRGGVKQAGGSEPSRLMAGGDGVWTCIKCCSSDPGLQLHGCGCRACWGCYFSLKNGNVRIGVPNGGCGLTECSRNYACEVALGAGLGFNSLAVSGLCLMFPDAGRGQERWESSQLVWMSDDFKMFVCDADRSVGIMQSDLTPADAISAIESDLEKAKLQKREERKKK